MSYIKDNLMPNEKILYTAQVNAAIFMPGALSFIGMIFFFISAMATKDNMATKILLIFIAIMFLIMTLKLSIEAAITIMTTELAITNRRVIAKTGFIHRNTIEILISKIESVKIYQNIIGRIMNFGTVTITGTGGTRESFQAIIDPTTAKKRINQIIEHYTQINNK